MLENREESVQIHRRSIRYFQTNCTSHMYERIKAEHHQRYSLSYAFLLVCDFYMITDKKIFL